MRIQLFALALGVAALVAPAAALAQTDKGFALDRFDVSEVGSDWFSGDSLDFRAPTRPAFGLTADYAHKPLVRYDENGDEVAAIIKHQVHAHLQASILLAERLRLAASLPVLLLQSGESTTINGQQFAAAEGAALGDLRLAADLRLFGEYGDVATMAVGAQVHLPTGDRAAFSGDGAVRVVPRLSLAGDISLFAYSVRASFNFRAQDDGYGDVPGGSELAFVATAGLRLADKALLIGPELWGVTGVTSDAFFKKETTPFEVILGGHYFAGPMRFGLGVGPGLTRGLGSPAVRVLGSLAYFMEADTDRDGDGIMDDEDACPDTAGVPHEDPKRNGCPSDRDDDGIYDVDDACPDEAGVASDDPEKHGCPLPGDRDGDGIIDDEDACPDVKGVESDDPEMNGCPPDRDGDGIIDDEDACPDVKGVETDDPETNGCPPDRDDDGIYDDDDACPDEPGVRSDDPDKHGCPLAKVEEGQIKILQRIEFETDKAKIRETSEVVLDAVLQIMKEHEEIDMVLVEGHTDNVGKAAYNRRLSQKRAASVVTWLVEHGIDRDRLRFEGKGFDEPIADNDTEVGRQENRRVEFHIEVVNGKPAKSQELEE